MKNQSEESLFLEECLKGIRRAVPEDRSEDVMVLMGEVLSMLNKGEAKHAPNVDSFMLIGTLMTAKGYLNWKHPENPIQFGVHGFDPKASEEEALFAKASYFSSLEVVAKSIERIPMFAIREATGVSYFANEYGLKDVEKTSVHLWKAASEMGVVTGQTDVLTEVAKVLTIMPSGSLLHNTAKALETSYLADKATVDPVSYFIRMPHRDGIHYSRITDNLEYRQH